MTALLRRVNPLVVVVALVLYLSDRTFDTTSVPVVTAPLEDPRPAMTSPPAPTVAPTLAPTTSSSATTVAPTGEQGSGPIDSAPPAVTGGTPAHGRSWSWFDMADCESGDRDENDNPIPGTARWTIHDHLHEGGLQFAISTWDGYRPDGFPDSAHLATVDQQIHVAEMVLAQEGVDAWPTCSRMIGAR